jgi:hypothetical protein
LPAGQQRRVPIERPQILAPEHRNQARELGLEPRDGFSLVDAGRLEVEREGTGGHSQSDPTVMTELEPCDLLRNERRRPEGKQEWCRRDPTRGVIFQDERRHLQRLRHVTGKTTVVLACHDAIEPVVEG